MSVLVFIHGIVSLDSLCCCLVWICCLKLLSHMMYIYGHLGPWNKD